MQQLTINIPDNKIAFFLDIAKNNGITIQSKAKKNTVALKQTNKPVNAAKQEKHMVDVAREFELYKEIWKRETRFSSSTTEMINHPSYLKIIALGNDAVPLLLRDMVQTGNHWFEALNSITGDDPIPNGHEGKIRKMIDDWVIWAQKNNVNY